MELVIKMSEEEYRKIWILPKDEIGIVLYDWIANGTPLPKGHGDLIDVTKLRYRVTDDGTIRLTSETIIEADKG